MEQCGAWHGEEMPLRRQGSTPQGAQTQRTTNYPFSRGAGLKSALRRAHEREDGRMGITDELRDYIEGAEQLYGRGCPRLTAMCDRIDEAHKKAMDDSYRDGYQEGKRDGDDEWYEEHESYLEEHGWYQVLDADKEPIKFGDDMEWELLGSGEVERGYVVGIKIDLIAGRQSCRIKVVRDSDFQTIELMAKNLHHVKPAEPEPTVEDMLRDYASRILMAGCIDEEDELVAEYAKRLTLRGDGE